MISEQSRDIEDWSNTSTEPYDCKHCENDAVLCVDSGPQPTEMHKKYQDIRKYL